MDLRLTFDEEEQNYDRWRPRYCANLFTRILEYSGVGGGSRALEVGIGTGQATLPFLWAGCEVQAVEYGANLAAYCKEKFAEYSGFQVYIGKFEEYEERKNSFDLLYSATAFHWMEEQAGYQKAYDLLKPGGTIALFWNRPAVDDPGGPLDEKIQRIYNTYRPGMAGKPKQETPYRKRYELLLKYGFSDVRTELFFSTRELSAREYICLLRTYSDHRAMPEEARMEFEREMVQAIESEGGIIRLRDTMDLYLGRK